VPHANAALTPVARLRLAQLIVEDRRTVSTAAKMFMVSPRTARKWADRYRAEGKAGMLDRSSRPHSSPNTQFPRQNRHFRASTPRDQHSPVKHPG
jgi:transposase-like protein